MIPFGDAVPAAIASAFSALKVSNDSFALPKTTSQPPSWIGM